MRYQLLIVLLLLPAATSAGADVLSLEPFANRTVVNITYSGNNVTKEHVITREIRTRIGEPLDPNTVADDITRLENLGIFASVTVVPTPSESGVELEFVLKEMPSILPYVAFRYTEENGFSVGPAASSVNLLGMDIYLTGRALFGGVSTFEVELNWPWITGNHFSFDFRAADLARDAFVVGDLGEQPYEEDSYEVRPWVGMYLGEHGRLRGGGSWFQMASDSAGVTLAENSKDNLFSLGGSLGYDNRDSYRNPHRGWWHELQVEKTGGWLGGEGDYLTVILDLQRYQPVTKNQTLEIGWLTCLRTGAVGVDVPPYLQYFMGGANSIRGYDIDVLGKELFGKNQLIVTVEYQYTLMQIRSIPVWKWAFAAGLEVAVFSDTGIAWSAENEFNRDRVKTGVGLGLRFLIPGSDVIRTDLAVGEDGEVLFHFAVWPKVVAQRFRVR